MGELLTAEELNELRERRWSAADARRVLKMCRGSGLSVSAFGARHGLAPQRLGWWKKRLAEWRQHEKAPTAAAAPMTLVPAVVVGGASPVAIRVNDVMFEVTDPAAVDPTWLGAVLSALASRPR
jgi:hypothetical protein